MTRLAFLPLVLAACFGSGPTPKPSQAEVVFAPQNATDCGGNATYIGDLALTPTGALALTLPYQPFNCQNNGTSPQGPQSVYMFDPNGSAGSTGTMIATLGSSQANGPPGARLVAAGAAGPLWIYSQSNGGNGSVNIGSPTLTGGEAVMLNNSGGGPNQLDGFPLAIAFDPSSQNVYVAAITSGAPSTDPDSPTFPCCGASGGIASGPVAIAALPTNLGAGSLVSQGNFQFAFGALTHSLVDDNAGHLFYLSSAMQNAVTLVDLANTMTATVQSHIAQPDPVGLGTDGQTVVFALSPLLQDNTTTPPPACEIYAFDIATQHVMPLLQTTSFSCMGAHIDTGVVYFAITSAPPEPNCPTCGPVVHGEGIGRITLADQTFESLAISVAGADAGPRHIYTQNGSIFAVDPLAVVRIDETALTGAHDFTP